MTDKDFSERVNALDEKINRIQLLMERIEEALEKDNKQNSD